MDSTIVAILIVVAFILIVVVPLVAGGIMFVEFIMKERMLNKYLLIVVCIMSFMAMALYAFLAFFTEKGFDPDALWRTFMYMSIGFFAIARFNE